MRGRADEDVSGVDKRRLKVHKYVKFIDIYGDIWYNSYITVIIF